MGSEMCIRDRAELAACTFAPQILAKSQHIVRGSGFSLFYGHAMTFAATRDQKLLEARLRKSDAALEHCSFWQGFGLGIMAVTALTSNLAPPSTALVSPALLHTI